MPAARYWRLSSFYTAPGENVRLAEIELRNTGSRVDTAATVSSPYAPVSGSLSNLTDGLTDAWAEFANSAGFFVQWDLGSEQSVDEVVAYISGVRRCQIEFLTSTGWEMFLPVVVDNGAAQPRVSGRLLDRISIVPLVLHTSFQGGGVNSSVHLNESKLLQGKWNLNYQHGTIDVGFANFSDTGVKPTTTAFIDRLATYVLTACNWAGSTCQADFDLEFLDDANQVVAALRTRRTGVGRLSFSYGPSLTSLTTLTPVSTSVDRVIGTLHFTGSSLEYTKNPSYTAYGSFSFACAASTITKVRISNARAYLSVNAAIADAFVQFYRQGDLVAKPVSFANNPIGVDPIRLGSYPVGDSVAKSPAQTAALDRQWGGTHRITGTVKNLGSPNQPVRRRVQLIHETSGIPIRETWSDAVTGEYTFSEISPQARYSVVAYDHTGVFRAVVADNLIPTP